MVDAMPRGESLSVFHNPVISGFHPDPSVCRVGNDYYLAVSSFAYLPGIPLFHSTNLTDWEPIGHVFDRPGMVDLSGLDVSDGLWAPTIRHHRGLFYVVTTIARNRRGAVTLLATAEDPAGPWSAPVVLDAEGIDPSLFFDNDGRCWFTCCRDAENPALTGPGELWMRELDLTTLALTGPDFGLWHGALRGAWVEAPHIFRRGEAYFLVAAEGGTEGNHSVTVARADSVTGPYAGDPRNPLLTHRHLGPDAPIQNVGHADLVETASGQTWAVVLGTRPVAGFQLLGREVFLVPVEWTDRGPVFAPGRGQVRAVEQRPATGGPNGGSLGGSVGRSGAVGGSGPLGGAAALRFPAGSGAVAREWLSLRGLPQAPDASGGFTVPLRPDTLAGTGIPAFMGRRQEHADFEFSLVLDWTPADGRPGVRGEEAGLAIHQGAAGFATATVQQLGGERILELAAVTGTGRSSLARAVLPSGPVRIRVSAAGRDYVLDYEALDAEPAEFEGLDAEPAARGRRTLGRVDGRILSTELVGGFVGVVLGPYATSNGQPTTASARFSDFSYRPAGA